MNETAKRMRLRIIVMVVILNMVMVSAVIYFLSPQGANAVDWLMHLPGPVLVSVLIGFFLSFFVLALFLGLRDTRQPPPELVKLSQDLGATLRRKWGFEGASGRVSLFGFGPYFEMNYRGILLSYSTLMDENNSWGAKVVVHHKRPLSIGFFLRYRASALTTPGRMPGEYKDLLARKLDFQEQGLEAWAVDKQRGILLLQSTRVLEALNRFRVAFEKILPGDYGAYHCSGFVMNDKSIAALVASPPLIEKELIEAMHDLSNALVSSGIIPAVPRMGLSDRTYKVILICLIVLIVVFAVLELGNHFLNWSGAKK